MIFLHARDFRKCKLFLAGLIFTWLGCACETVTQDGLSSPGGVESATPNSSVSSQITPDDVMNARQQEMMKKMSRQGGRPFITGPSPLKR